VFAAFAVGPLVLLSGCGGDDDTGASNTLVEIQPSSYVTLPAATTTTTTTLPEGATGEQGPGQADGEQQYTVRGGDSVYGIAERYNVDPVALANYNDWPEGIDHFLKVGDVVKIPPGADIPGSGGGDTGGDTTGDGGDGGGDTTSGGDGTSEATGEGCTYTIVAGDNPSKVANKFDITVDELFAANSESVMSSFLVGAVLTIPANGNC